MQDQNIYIVESKDGELRKLVAAQSTAAARAVVSRDILTVRRARPIELLGVNPATVIDASAAEPKNAELPLGDPEA